MRYARDHKQQTRSKILSAAGRVFRRQGFQGAGVDKVMEEAGLTAGGFYAHFESKQALLAEAIVHAGAEVVAGHAAKLEGLSGREWVEAFVSRYLGPAHRERPEEGCPLVALLSEVARADGRVKATFETMVRELSGLLEANAGGGGEDGPAGERALAALALCVGGLGVARAVRDEALADRILGSCRDQAVRILCGGGQASG